MFPGIAGDSTFLKTRLNFNLRSTHFYWSVKHLKDSTIEEMMMSVQFLRACLFAVVVKTSLELPAPSIVRPCDRPDGCRKTRPDAMFTETGSTADWLQDDAAAEDDLKTPADVSEISHEPAQDNLVFTELLKSLQQIQRKANSTKQFRLGKLLSGLVMKQTRRRKAKASKPNTVLSLDAVTTTPSETRDVATTSSDFVATKTATPSTPHQQTASTPTQKPDNDITFDVEMPEWFWAAPERTLSPFQFYDDTPPAAAELRDDETVQPDGTLSVDTNFGGEILPLPDRLGPDHTSIITSSEQDLLDQLTLWSKMSLEADKSAYPLGTELEGEETTSKQDEKLSSLRKEKPDTSTETLRCYRDLETRTTYYRGRPCPRQTRPQLTDPLCHTRRFLAANGCCKEWWVVCN
ncbi:uncharacterized protein [Branchiostoma lanceolatum]|uniref:uncharacterized protein n=1 Tax=Branchiostoma lanceolatum TaxID=7740 RepID=UPI0034546D77